MSGEAVTVVTPGSTTDRHGNTVADWSAAAVTRVVVSGAAWAPGHLDEDHTGGRQAVPVDGTLYLPPSATVTAHDRVEVRGDTYEIDGEPGVWRHPTSGADRGIELRLRRTTG